MSSIDMQAGPSTRSDNAGSVSPLTRLASIRTGTIIIVLVAVALVLRLWELGERPFHHDESLDAHWSRLFSRGEYPGYDPVYHGPLRFYITAGLFWLFGETDAVARLFSALSGTAVVALPWFLRRELGRAGTIAAAVALTVSPTMLYYSRFGREDAQMVFLTLLAMVLGLSYLRSPRTSSAAALLFVLACSFAIKESTYLFILLLGIYVLVVVGSQFDAQARRHMGLQPDEQLNPGFVLAMVGFATVGLLISVVVGAASDELFLTLGLYAIALISITALLGLHAHRQAPTSPFEPPPLVRAMMKIGVAGWAIALGTFAFSWLAFFTVWGQQPGDWGSGVTEAIKYWDSQQEENRGGQPWFYYLYALPVYEWLFVLLSFVGGWRALRRPTMASILFVWFAIGSFILYSYAGERMPWLIAHPLLPLLVLAGYGIQQLVEHRERAGMAAVATAVGFALIFTTATSIRASFPNGSDSREILSQAGQATPHVTAALERLDNLDQITMREQGRPAKLAIGTFNAWPWSWYLRDRPDVRWFTPEQGPPTDGSVDVIIVDRGVIELDSFPDYQSTLFAMRSWWVPVYNAGGIGGWLGYASDRTLWEQDPNLGYQGIAETTDDHADDRSRLTRLRDGAYAGANEWFAVTGSDRVELYSVDDGDAFLDPDDGRDGCGSVDQWFLVHNNFAATEQMVYPQAVAKMGPLACASDSLALGP